METDDGDGIAKGCAVLDAEPFNGIGVVARPDLWRVVHHAGIKSAATAAAVLITTVNEP